MALVKSSEPHEAARQEISTLDEALDGFHAAQNDDDKLFILESIVSFSEGAKKLVELMREHESDKVIVSHIAGLLSRVDPAEAPIEELLQLMSIENAFVRNAAITTLQAYGEEIKYYIVKYLVGNDRDLRIFAVNVLGDVKFKSSRDMLMELLEKEQDINVAMTAVDYLAEIGEVSDIAALERLKSRFESEPYACFAIDKTIASIKG